MGVKKQNLFQFQWQASAPVPVQPILPPSYSGVVAGVMSGTSTIYSNYLDLTNYDNNGLEITWTGTPTGTITYFASDSGINFYALSNFSPTLKQPSGSGDGYLLNLNQIPYKYIYIKYTNASGSGVLSAWMNQKDIN